MAFDTTNWSKLPGGPGGQGILTWNGPGGAPLLDPATQRAFRSALGFAPGGALPNAAAPEALNFEEGSSDSGGGGGVKYDPGPVAGIINGLLSAAIGGGDKGGPAGRTLYQLAGGNIPPAIQAQYQQNLERNQASITEGMGVVGQRFGTDLTRTLSEAAGQANVNLSAAAMDRALSAIGQIIGLGTGAGTIELGGQNAALDASNQQFLASQANDPLMSFLRMLLSTGGGGGFSF